MIRVFSKSFTGHVETNHSAIEQTTKIKLFTLPIITAISLLSGFVLFLICNTVYGTFQDSEKILVFFAFTVMSFELTWLIYGLATWILGAFHISDEYSDIIV